MAAVQAEEAGEKQRAIELYEQILALDPAYAAACINLGTVYFHLRQFGRAEEFYSRATEIDPGYVLAYFDLGNVLDELERLEESIAAYQRAVTLSPALRRRPLQSGAGLRAQRRGALRAAPLAGIYQARQPRTLGRPRPRPDSQAAEPRKARDRVPRQPVHPAAQGQRRVAAARRARISAKAHFEGIARATSAICAGRVRQHPPTICAPARNHSAA